MCYANFPRIRKLLHHNQKKRSSSQKDWFDYSFKVSIFNSTFIELNLQLKIDTRHIILKSKNQCHVDRPGQRQKLEWVSFYKEIGLWPLTHIMSRNILESQYIFGMVWAEYNAMY